MGSQLPIPVSEVVAYGRIAGFEEYELLFLYRAVKKLETVWLEHRKTKGSNGEGGKGAKAGVPQASRPPRRRSRR